MDKQPQDPKILIVDDLIATGGTIAAAVKLVETLGGDIVELAFIVELPDLKGREEILRIHARNINTRRPMHEGSKVPSAMNAGCSG